MQTMPIRAYQHDAVDFGDRSPLLKVVYPETGIVLTNTANPRSNVIGLYFKAAAADATRKVQGIDARPAMCGKNCASCRHYHPFYSLVGRNEASQEPEGRCILHRIPGKRVREGNTCEKWETVK